MGGFLLVPKQLKARGGGAPESGSRRFKEGSGGPAVKQDTGGSGVVLCKVQGRLRTGAG